MKILVLGATGFIGSAIAAKLLTAGHGVTGIGRRPGRMARKMPAVSWQPVDLAGLTAAADWSGLLDGQDVVVNAAGALQDGLLDDVAATQERAMLALYEAARAKGIMRIVQISAETQGPGRDVAFLATKRAADDALAASGVPFVILRPSVVLGRNAHGGSALLRALAALPFALPLVHARQVVATSDLDALASAVADAVAGTLPAGSDIAFAAADRSTLGDLVGLHRSWLGLPAARAIDLPPALAKPVTWLADLAGRLGWRSPLRSTAMTLMAGGLAGAATAARQPTARETLAANPSGVQDLWFARLYLLKPVIVVGLALFWLASGLIPFLSLGAARTHMEAALPPSLAGAATVATCFADITVGLAVLVRPWAKTALIGMLVLSLGYLAGATLATPGLWLDPLGPLVKVIPAMLLALVALAILDER
ncbi:hypothetical protein BN1110_03021 [bacterium YEK0313]|nr:hypothetical protein BN1110_03021 [bacterium YEK0313]